MSINNENLYKYIPQYSRYGFFGWTTIPNTPDSIIITNNEINAMSIYQETKLPSISLPYNLLNFPLNVL